MLNETKTGETRTAPALAPAIALAHLKSQTMNDQDLEREVLTLFRRLSVDHLDRMKSATTVEDCREVAHSLAGAARGVGAFTVAEIASEVESAGTVDRARIETLEGAVQAATDFIADHLSG